MAPREPRPRSLGSRIRSVSLPAMMRALRHRNYRLFIGGQLISLIGTWMQSVAQSWLVYRLTGSSVLLGTVGFVSQIPVFVLAPVGGAVADRYSRHRIVIGTQVASMVLAFVLAALALTGTVRVWHILVLASLLGVVNAFDIPGRQSLIVELTSREDLMNAIALNSSIFNGARVAGPAIAGILVATIGEAWCFFANGVSYIAVIAGLLLMRVPPRAQEPAHEPPVRQMIDGFRFVAGTRPILALLALLGLVSIVGTPYSVLMPILADRVLHGGSRGLGLLMGASGVGALGGALALASRRTVRGLGDWVAYASAGFGVALVVFSFSRTLWLSAVLLLPVGFALMVQMASSNTLIQSMVPDRLRGRVMAVYSMMFMGMAPVGALLAGVAADRFGVTRTIGLGGAVCVMGSAVFFHWLPKIRGEARALIIAQQAVGGDPPQEAAGGGVGVDEPAVEQG